MGAPQPLWDGPAPLASGSTENDTPALTSFPAPGPRPRGDLLILPGGGYGALAAHEGEGYARFFTALGLECHVLRYRLGSHGYRHPAMLLDAQRALRTVRRQARDAGRNPAAIGVIGSSAGGHLAATLLTQPGGGSPGAADPVERESSRPDWGVLCYPVITFGEHRHDGSRRNLLGDAPPPELIQALSAEHRVGPTTPPVFLWHTVDDPAVPVENALLFASALRRHGVPFELHLYESGRHGLGLGDDGRHPWTTEVSRWLDRRLGGQA